MMSSVELGVEDQLKAVQLLDQPAEEFGNDSRLEMLWAMKAMDHATVYFNILCSVDPAQIPRLSARDDDIYSLFRATFPDMSVAKLDVNKDLDTLKPKWREFCEQFKELEDFNLATLLRVDSSEDYEEANTVVVPKVQFYAVELARNREGHNSQIRHKFKPKPRQARHQTATAAPTPEAQLESELLQILGQSHPMLQ